MNNSKKILVAVLAAAIVLSAGIFLTKENKSETQQEVTIRYLAQLGYIEPYELADQLGYFEGTSIKIERVGSYTGGPEDIISVSTGSTEVGHTAWTALINAKARGVEVTAIAAPMGNSPSQPYLAKWFVLENSSIRNANDLTGKKIAVNSVGAHVDYITREYLQRNGVPRDAVQLVTLSPSKNEQVLRQGQVDVVAPLTFFVDKLEESDDVRVLFSDYEIIGDQTHCALFMSDEFLREQPDVAKRFVEVTTKAVDWSEEHPEETKKLVANIFEKKGANPDLAKYWKGFGVREHAVLADSDVQFWIDWMVNDGKIQEGQFKPSDIYTNEFNPHYER